MGVLVAATGSSDVPRGDTDSGTAALRAHLLTMYDLSLLSNAPNYDLRERSERQRSVRDLEKLFFLAVKFRQPELFIEAGAKDARTSRRARQHLEDARIVAFEANPFVHERFRARNQRPEHRIEYHHLALSDGPGEVSFNVRKAPDGTPLADGRGSLKEMAAYEHGTESVTVEATSLDRYFADWNGSGCALWIDVEGAAEQVLTGGARILSRADLVFIEVEDRDMWVWGPAWTTHDVIDHLFDRGLVPVARDYQARFQYNVLFASPTMLQDYRFRTYLALHNSAVHGQPVPSEPGPSPGPLRSLRQLLRRGRG